MTTPTLRTIPIWDLPIRLFHWTLVLLLGLLYWSGEAGESFGEMLDRLSPGPADPMVWHARFGYTLAGFLAFRLLWGFFGSQTARFREFLHQPAEVWKYLRALRYGNSAPAPGHNPAGGWMVAIMLGTLIVQVTTGLFGRDDVDFEAPLAHLVSEDISEALVEIHEANFDVLLVLIGLHLLAIVFYRVVKRENLVAAMLTGHRDIPASVPVPGMAPAWRFWLCAAAATALMVAVTA